MTLINPDGTPITPKTEPEPQAVPPTQEEITAAAEVAEHVSGKLTTMGTKIAFLNQPFIMDLVAFFVQGTVKNLVDTAVLADRQKIHATMVEVVRQKEELQRQGVIIPGVKAPKLDHQTAVNMLVALREVMSKTKPPEVQVNALDGQEAQNSPGRELANPPVEN